MHVGDVCSTPAHRSDRLARVAVEYKLGVDRRRARFVGTALAVAALTGLSLGVPFCSSGQFQWMGNARNDSDARKSRIVGQSMSTRVQRTG